ncbi:MAG: D-alanyl-D-alanine carboxypeptidase/D-alanyl-D-alanine-endopeptidase [Actinomycetes bacterium]
MRLRRVLGALVALLLVSALVAGTLTGLFADVARGGLSATGLGGSGDASIPSGTVDTPGPARPPSSPVASEPAPAVLPSPVLLVAEPGQPPRPVRVAAAVEKAADGKVGGRISASVLDVGSGKVLYASRARRAAVPASTMKLLTSAAALSALGADHRFTTRVLQPERGQIVLVGGGDPYLSGRRRAGRASVAELAALTARRLEAAGQTRVALRYDASRFTGPAFAPSWPASYADQVTSISALWVDQGRVTGGSPGGRVADPAAAAGRAFARELKREGITVRSVKAGRAPRRAAALASVPSMPLGRIVELLLTASDNDAAEVVLRQAALASGQPGSFTGGRRAVGQRLRALGVWLEGTAIADGSGLSRDTKVPAESLTRLLRLAVDDDHPELRPLLSGLPVAGVEGSLRSRFLDDASVAGRGLVRAKTGTLRQVHALAGYVRSVDGSLLVFAFLVNDARNEYEAKLWLDRVTSALSQCGCR